MDLEKKLNRSPIEVFNEPNNVFVATFIGSPPMNIMKADVVKKENNIYFKVDDELFIPCPEFKQKKVNNEEKVLIGIRAEDISATDQRENNPNSWYFEKNIELSEPLGTETQLFLKLNNKEIISRMYNPREIKVGEKLTFAVNLKKIHLFNHKTEEII